MAELDYDNAINISENFIPNKNGYVYARFLAKDASGSSVGATQNGIPLAGNQVTGYSFLHLNFIVRKNIEVKFSMINCGFNGTYSRFIPFK